MEIKRTTEFIIETKRRFVIEPLETTIKPIVLPRMPCADDFGGRHRRAA